MIVAALGPELPTYRMHTPRWSFQPLSGAGAAISGGRLNRPGIDALYLALEPETAIEEFRQDDPLVRPGTLVAYRATIARVADFRAGYEAASHRWAAALFVNNVFDKRYVTSVGNMTTGLLGTPYAMVNAPRQVGVELRINL